MPVATLAPPPVLDPPPSARADDDPVGRPQITATAQVPAASEPTVSAPGAVPLGRLIQLEQDVLRLRRDLGRMHRVVALLEQTVAVERILATHPSPTPGPWGRFWLWIGRFWSRRTSP